MKLLFNFYMCYIGNSLCCKPEGSPRSFFNFSFPFIPLFGEPSRSSYVYLLQMLHNVFQNTVFLSISQAKTLIQAFGFGLWQWPFLWPWQTQPCSVCIHSKCYYKDHFPYLLFWPYITPFFIISHIKLFIFTIMACPLFFIVERWIFTFLWHMIQPPAPAYSASAHTYLCVFLCCCSCMGGVANNHSQSYLIILF